LVGDVEHPQLHGPRAKAIAALATAVLLARDD
jgi:hypothetical protein